MGFSGIHSDYLFIRTHDMYYTPAYNLWLCPPYYYVYDALWFWSRTNGLSAMRGAVVLQEENSLIIFLPLRRGLNKIWVLETDLLIRSESMNMIQIGLKCENITTASRRTGSAVVYVVFRFEFSVEWNVWIAALGCERKKRLRLYRSPLFQRSYQKISLGKWKIRDT